MSHALEEDFSSTLTLYLFTQLFEGGTMFIYTSQMKKWSVEVLDPLPKVTELENATAGIL